MTRVFDVKAYLPEIITNAEPFKSILDAENLESERIFESVEDLMSQLFIDTATWGLDYWEQFLGLQKKNLSYEDRRTACKTRIRGAYQVTKKGLESIVKQYTSGAFQIVEDYNDYRIRIIFLSDQLPSSYKDFIKAITDLLPAHIYFTAEYSFNTHYDLEALKHITMQSYTHNELATNKNIII